MKNLGTMLGPHLTQGCLVLAWSSGHPGLHGKNPRGAACARARGSRVTAASVGSLVGVL
jgi:hypothetical protein